MRILFVTPRCYPEMGGIETHVYEVAHRLAAHGNQITVLSTDRSGKLDAESTVEGVRIVRVPAYPRSRDLYIAPALPQHIRAGQYDVLHVQGFHTFVPPLAMWAARRANIPYVVTFHSGGHSQGWRNIIRPTQAKLQRSLLANAQKLIGVSHFEAEQFRVWLNLPADRFTVVPNGAALPAMPPDFQKSDDGHETILSVGRLEKYKGHHRLIAAMPLVLARRPNARLKILGLGAYENTLRDMVQSMQLADHVEITHVPPGDRSAMTREMMNAALVTLFSEYEAHPIAVMEAAALRCSILVADTSGLSELAEQGLAKSIPLNSTPEALANAIVNQLEHPHRADAVTLPTWERCTEQLFHIYTQVARTEHTAEHIGVPV